MEDSADRDELRPAPPDEVKEILKSLNQRKALG